MCCCCGCIFSFCLMFLLFPSLQGKPKKNESLWGVACGVFRMLRKNYGCVRVDFTQPFSLKVRAAHLCLVKYKADLSPNDWILLLYRSRNTWTHSAVGIFSPLSHWSRSFSPPSSLHSMALPFRLPATNIIMWTAVYWYVERCEWLMGLCSIMFFCADLIRLFLMEKMRII